MPANELYERDLDQRLARAEYLEFVRYNVSFAASEWTDYRLLRHDALIVTAQFERGMMLKDRQWKQKGNMIEISYCFLVGGLVNRRWASRVERERYSTDPLTPHVLRPFVPRNPDFRAKF